MQRIRLDHYPGRRLKELLAEAGLHQQFEHAIRQRDDDRIKELISRVANNQEEVLRYVGVVFANPQHYDRVISDLHYNDKTVAERLATEDLLDEFSSATAAGDGGRMIDLLQQVAINTSWARRLVAMILDGPPQPPMTLQVEDPRNAGLQSRSNGLKLSPCLRPIECPRDPFMSLGCHPDIVERVWDQLGSAIPIDCRCVVFGAPGLVAPRSGVLLAMAMGTAYIIRLAGSTFDEALRAGARTKMTWGDGRATDLLQEFGEDWIFGKWLPQEPDWLRATFDAIENTRK